jgi:hypothetical protein
MPIANRPTFWCDGVTACDKKITKKRYARALNKNFPGFAVTRCHTAAFCHTGHRLIVLRCLKPYAEPHSNLLGVPSAVRSYPILFPAQFLQPFIEEPL